MFNSTKVKFIFYYCVMYGHRPDFYTFVFNEDIKVVQNFHGRNWEMDQIMFQSSYKDIFVVGFPKTGKSESMFQAVLWKAASEAMSLQYLGYHVQKNESRRLFLMKSIDVFLLTHRPDTFEVFLRPFVKAEFAIFYKAGDFHVSSTYFMDGLSTELWIYTWSTVALMFIGFYTSAKVYEKFFKVRSSIVDVAFYQMNFVSNQIVESPYKNFKAWRVQTLCGWFFNIVMMTASFTLIVALLSVKQTSVPFKSLDDFAAIQSHTICLPDNIVPQRYFVDKFGKVRDEFKGIYNAPKCENISLKVGNICDHDDIAVVWPIHQISEDRLTCKVLKLSGVFPTQYGSIMIQNNFKFRDKFNQIYLRMQTAGIVQRAQNKYMSNKLKKKYEAKEHYQVELEGVLFEHVQFIFLVYLLIFPTVLIVLAFEIIHNRIALRKKVEPITDHKVIEYDGSLFDETTSQLSYPSNDSISSISNQLTIDDLIENLDLQLSYD